MEGVAGIYKIANKETGRAYIGESFDVGKRCKSHFSRLTKGNHNIVQMQQDFVSFGRNSFEAMVLEELEPNMYEKRQLKALLRKGETLAIANVLTSEDEALYNLSYADVEDTKQPPIGILKGMGLVSTVAIAREVMLPLEDINKLVEMSYHIVERVYRGRDHFYKAIRHYKPTETEAVEDVFMVNREEFLCLFERYILAAPELSYATKKTIGEMWDEYKESGQVQTFYYEKEG